MKTLKFLLISFMLWHLAACNGNAYHEELVGGYFLYAVDVRSDMILGYKDGKYGIGIIKATVYAAGYNDKFIILKQHPREFADEQNTAITNYYIIPIKNKISRVAERNYYGPYSLDGFMEKKKDLNITDIDFSIVFEDLE